jgi:hypothetical protein
MSAQPHPSVDASPLGNESAPMRHEPARPPDSPALAAADEAMHALDQAADRPLAERAALAAQAQAALASLLDDEPGDPTDQR